MYDIDDTDHILTVEFDNKGLFNYVDNIKVNTGIVNNEKGNSVEVPINNITELILFNKEYTYKNQKEQYLIEMKNNGLKILIFLQEIFIIQ